MDLDAVRDEGRLALLMRQLQRRLGGLPGSDRQRIEALAAEQLDSLGEALLDFNGRDDLAVWFEQEAARR